MRSFVDRAEAGALLGHALSDRRREHPVVLGLPRGGVPVAFEVAQALDAPLDVIVVRKLGLPDHPEVAMGAIGEGGARVLNRSVLDTAGVTEEELAAVEGRERRLLDARVARLRRGHPRVAVEGREVIVVDDGVATGSTAQVACRVVRRSGASKVVVAVPVAPASAVEDLLGSGSEAPGTRRASGNGPAGPRGAADEVVCLLTPARFVAVGVHYRDFTPTTDDQVVELLERARAT